MSWSWLARGSVSVRVGLSVVEGRVRRERCSSHTSVLISLNNEHLLVKGRPLIKSRSRDHSAMVHGLVELNYYAGDKCFWCRLLTDLAFTDVPWNVDARTNINIRDGLNRFFDIIVHLLSPYCLMWLRHSRSYNRSWVCHLRHSRSCVRRHQKLPSMACDLS